MEKKTIRCPHCDSADVGHRYNLYFGLAFGFLIVGFAFLIIPFLGWIISASCFIAFIPFLIMGIVNFAFHRNELRCVKCKEQFTLNPA